MLESYAAIGMMLTTAFFMGATLLLLGWLIRPSKPSPAKEQPYESGLADIRPPKGRYTSRFYIVALLFVIFDIEAIFLFPWAVAFDQLALYGYVQAVIFISILLFGLLYEWKKGALEWA